MYPNEGSRFEFVPCADQSTEWLEVRRSGIGGSDVAAVMGLSPWCGPYEVWCRKTGLVEVPDIGGSPAVRWGHLLEGVVADEYARAHPDQRVVNPRGVMRSVERPWAQASLDRIARDPVRGWGVLEVKTAGMHSARMWDGGVPLHYLTQVQHYLDVTGYGWAVVAVLIGGQDYREYEVAPDRRDMGAIRSDVDLFWHCNVEAGVEPPTGVQSCEARLLAARHPAGDGTYTEADDLVRSFVDARERVRDAKAREAEVAARVRDLVAAEGSEGVEGAGHRVTWSRTEKRQQLRVKEI